jgi:primosomal protein N' (replication factor Y)
VVTPETASRPSICAANRVVKVAFDLPRLPPFDYLAGDTGPDDVGRIVVAPLGRHQLAGVIVGYADTSEWGLDKLKPLTRVQREWPAFAPAEMAAFRFCADYYHHAIGAVALNALPPKLRSAKAFVRARVRHVAPGATARAWLTAPPPRARALTAVLQSVVDGIRDDTTLKSMHPRAVASINALLDRGLIVVTEAAPPMTRTIALHASPALNAAQQSAVDAINATAGRFVPFLIDGITGSGKTEVYLHAIAHAIRHGGQALVLMPEINLTPQFLRHLAVRLPGARMVSLHSALSAGERVERHLAVAEGRADIVIGTRLAVFAPLPDIKLIVVDEEHDSSFKQQEGLRYSARDVAVFRARHAACPIVLGSATPSLESIANVERARFTELRLTQRANNAARLPTVEFIDLNLERASDGLSQPLRSQIGATLERREQALLFINRRGFAPTLLCTQCGHMNACTRCSARLTFHRRDKRLKCHHCGHEESVPQTCPECGSIVIVAVGEGTERVEAALERAFPQARIARVDRDAVRNKGAMERVLGAAAKGEIDILVGTQMLAKGHDFPNLTLVGVINADGAMFSANFRATERLVATLIQVGGRAGRAERAGRVLIQTAFADHPFYRAIARHDYRGFAELALSERRESHLPPFAHLALLRAECDSSDALHRFMQAVSHAAHDARHTLPDQAIDIWDAVAPTLARKAGFERAQLMVQSPSRVALHAFLEAWLAKVDQLPARKVKWIVDVDPVDV